MRCHSLCDITRASSLSDSTSDISPCLNVTVDRDTTNVLTSIETSESMHITVRMQVPRTSLVLAVVLVSPGTRGLVQRDATE